MFPNISHPAAQGIKDNLQIALDNTKQLLLGVSGYLWRLNVEQLDGTNDLFIQMFNAATTGAVTLGTTVPDFTFYVPGGKGHQSEGQMAVPMHFFPLGLVVAATTTRTGSTNPTTKPNVLFFVSPA